MSKLLEVKNLQTCFYSKDKRIVSAINDVNFSIKKGETLGIVGESGCGKSVTALSILQLIQPHSGMITQGEILLNGQDLLKLNEKKMQQIRGNQISMIFQEPMTSLNPSFTIGYQLIGPIRLHRRCSRKDAYDYAVSMLHMVGIASPEQRMKEYPHQLSGGMRQRVMIAMALSCEPELLIADEPTTALDVTIQAQILELMKQLQEKLQMSIILITHDMGVVMGMCDNIAIMYAGNVIEFADKYQIFNYPKHPYTKGLLSSIPSLDYDVDVLNTIPGIVPSISNMPSGCKFGPRCQHTLPICKQLQPKSIQVGNDHSVSCWLYEQEGGES